jgi:FixJ family two-component response regulator
MSRSARCGSCVRTTRPRSHLGQRHRPARGPRAAVRALCHHARQGHRPWPAHRQEDHRGTWRHAGPDGCGAVLDGTPHRRDGRIRCPRSPHRRTAGRRRTGEGKRHGMTDILIVDDERDIRELISDILRDEGYETRTAGNSDDCMAAINAEPARADDPRHLAQGQPDGRDRHPQDRARDNPEVPVVIISGHGNIEIAVAAIKQGAYDFIEKPFNIDQLMVVIGRAMETARLRRENTNCAAATWPRPRWWALARLQVAEGAARQGDEVERPGHADRARPARARRWPRATSTPIPTAPRAPSSPSPPPRSSPTGWKRCSSAAKARARGRARACWNRRMAGCLFRRGGRHAARHAVEDPARADRTAVHSAPAAPTRCGSTCA